jgi:hypothetical protein
MVNSTNIFWYLLGKMSIINLARTEQLAKSLKTLSGDIPSTIEYLKSLKECAKLLGLQISAFYDNQELFIYILSKICDDKCPYPDQDDPFWQFRLTDDDRCYGKFDYSQIFSDEFVEFKRAYLENLQIEIDARLKSFEDQCPIAELEKLKNQFDDFFQKYNEITQHLRNHSLSSVESDDEGLNNSLREINDFFCNFDSKFSECQEKIDVLKEAVFDWGHKEETEMESLFESFIESLVENDSDVKFAVYENEFEYGWLFKLQRVQRMLARIVFGSFFVDSPSTNLNFLDDYNESVFEEELNEIRGIKKDVEGHSEN